MEQKKVNWFIGHMKKTVDVLESKKKNIDFLIEIVDARLPYTSSNPELLKIFENKPIIKIAIKSDLIKKSDYKKDLIYCSIKNKADRKKVINAIDLALKEKKEKYLKKNLIKPIFVGAVVGLPNIGKSSIINFLANKKVLNVENRPGVTRKVENIKIGDGLFLMDTPGVFLKNVEDYNDGLNLALINCVSRNVVDNKDLAEHLFKILQQKNLLNIVEKDFDIEGVNTFDDYVNKISIRRNINTEIDQNLEQIYMVFVKKIFDSGLNLLILE